MAFRSGWTRLGILAVLVVGAFFWPLPALADSSRAGVIILHHLTATPTAVCVTFQEKELTGIDLLHRAQPDLITQVSLAGEAVCKIGSTGCNYPAEDCFCACRGAECRYWSYWYREGGRWVYSGRGASRRTVRHGDLDAWVWGDGQTAPPEMAWEDVCSSQTSALAAQNAPNPSLPNTPLPAQQEPYPGITNTPAPAATPNPNGPYPGPAPTNTTAPAATETFPPRPTATERPSPTPREIAPLKPTAPTGVPSTAPSATPQPQASLWPTTAPATLSPSPQPAVSPTAVLAPGGAFTPTVTADLVALKIRTGVARARATAQVYESASASPARQYGAFLALFIALGALVGGLAIARRRRMVAALHPSGLPHAPREEPLPPKGNQPSSGNQE